MTATITINMDNAAFTDNPDELRRIFDEIKERLDYWSEFDGIPVEYPIHDINGNKVGQWSITDPEHNS
jgi:hypothetical protein